MNAVVKCAICCLSKGKYLHWEKLYIHRVSLLNTIACRQYYNSGQRTGLEHVYMYTCIYNHIPKVVQYILILLVLF